MAETLISRLCVYADAHKGTLGAAAAILLLSGAALLCCTRERPSKKRHTVVVVGGGFAGLDCVAHLDHRDFDVLLVDRKDYHEYTPSMHEVISSKRALSFAPMVRYKDDLRCVHCRHFEGDVAQVSLNPRTLLLRGDGQSRHEAWDFLVMTTGATYSSPVKAQATEHTLVQRKGTTPWAPYLQP